MALIYFQSMEYELPLLCRQMEHWYHKFLFQNWPNQFDTKDLQQILGQWTTWISVTTPSSCNRQDFFQMNSEALKLCMYKDLYDSMWLKSSLKKIVST